MLPVNYESSSVKLMDRGKVSRRTLQKQLAGNLNIDMSNIQDLKSWEGGVEVMSPTNLMSLNSL